MRTRNKLLIGVLCLIMSAALIVPAMAEKAGKGWEHFKAGKEKVIKSLNLAPDKMKEITATDEKYSKDRKEIFATLKKDYGELEKAVSAPKPEEMKVKNLVTSITSTQDRLFKTFEEQRNAELGLMTPVQQGKYLLGMRKLYHESMGGAPKKPEKK